MAASVQALFPFDLSPVVEAVIEQVRFTWKLADPVLAQLPGAAPFWIVRRAQLDAFLVQRALEAGACFRQGCAVQAVQRRGGRWQVRQAGAAGDSGGPEAAALVIADGSGSRLVAGVGLGPSRPRFATTVSVELDGEVRDPATAHFAFGLVPQGFCWAFPRRGGTSIGLGSFIGRPAAAAVARSEADAVLSRLLPSLGYAPDAGERTVNRLRVWDGHHPLHGEGVLVAGDAASLCDPFLAEGLRPALLSGCRAAAAIHLWLAGDAAALPRYSEGLQRDWGESMAWGRRIASVFYRVPRVGYQLGIKRPTAPRRIAQILSGELGYGDIAQRAIRRLLFQRG